jgi:protein TonB
LRAAGLSRRPKLTKAHEGTRRRVLERHLVTSCLRDGLPPTVRPLALPVGSVASDLGIAPVARSAVSNTVEVENMFRDIIDPAMRVRSRKAFVLPLSIVTHVLLVAILLLIPLMAPGVLPMPTAALMAFVTRDVDLPPPPPPAPRQHGDASEPVVDVHQGAAPLEPPSVIAPESAVDSAPALIETVEGAGIVSGGIAEDPIPPPPLPPPSAPSAPVPVGGNIRPPTKIKDVRPVYPPIAQAARVEGVVIIVTTIGPTGRVLDAKVIRSLPLLDAAALEAVRQWEFTPTLLNGSPVAVLLTVTVNFMLR